MSAAFMSSPLGRFLGRLFSRTRRIFLRLEETRRGRVFLVLASAILLSGSIFVLAELGGYGVSGPATAPNSLDYGLVGYWDMEGAIGQTVKDKSGNGNDGTLGTLSTVDSYDPAFGPGYNFSGPGGMAAVFDGAGDAIKVTSSDSLSPTSAITVDAWIKPDGVQPDHSRIIDKGYNISYSLNVTSANKLEFQANLGGVAQTFLSTGTFTPDVFTNVTAIYNGTNVMFYINGVSAGTLTPATTGAIAVGASDFSIGVNTGVGNAFRGVLDEVRVYNRALSVDEVELLYNQKKPILHLKMDEGAGTTLYDDSFNNYDAKIYNKINTAISSTANTLTDNDINWATDYWAGQQVSILYGTGSGQTRTVSSNTNVTLTVSQNWTVAPDSTSRYSITLPGSNWTDRNAGSAVYLNDVGHIGYAPNINPVTGNSDFSMAAWIKTNSATNQTILAQRTPAGIDGEYIFSITSSGNVDYWDYNNGYGIQLTSNKTVSDNAWHHIEFIRQGNVGYMYIDGIFDNSVSGTAVTMDPTFIFAIGVDCRDAVSYLNGSIDDVRVYNYARTADEVMADYNDNSTARLGSDTINLDKGLIGYWDMEEGSGQTVYDKSGNGNNGTLGSASSAGSDDPLFGPGHNSTGSNGTGTVFDGVNDYIDLPSSVPGNYLSWNKDYSVGFWVNANDLVSVQEVLIYSTSGTDRGGVRIRSNTIGAGTYNGTTSSYASGTITSGWHHVGILHRADNTMSMYIDGILQTGVMSNSFWSSNEFAIGGTTGGTSVNGSMDEVRFYNRILSVDEVRYLYNQKKPVLDLKMDEGSGRIAHDQSFNNNDATIYGEWGQAESGGASTLTDTNRTWTANEWVGETIEITGGTGSGQERTVASNTTNEVTVSSVWDTNPDATSIYRITSKGLWTSGKNKSALGLDGSHSFTEVANPTSFDFISNDFTLEAWVYAGSQVTNAGRIINKMKTSTASSYFLAVDTSGNVRYFISGVATIDRTYTGKDVRNGWHHLAATFTKSGSALLYIDGVNVDSVDISGVGNLTSYAKMFVGGMSSASSMLGFNGSVDDARVYNYARTANEILTDYNGGSAVHMGKNENDLDYGLVGYWDMEEGRGQAVKDKSENGNDGVFGDTSSVESNDPVFGSGHNAEGEGGLGVSFDGYDDYAIAGTDSSLNVTGAITMSAWVKPLVSDGNIVRKVDENLGYMMHLMSDQRIQIGINDFNSYLTTSNGVITLNSWNYIVATVDASGAGVIYVNGSSVATGNLQVLNTTATNPFMIGGDSWNTGIYFSGTIDEARLYNRAISADEVRMLYNQKKPILQLKMDEGSGASAKDDSFNNNDGSLGGGTAANMPIWTTGKFGTGLSFDGIDDYISVADSNSLDMTGKFTIEAWLYPTELNAEDCIFSKGGVGGSCSNYDLYLYSGKLALLSSASCNWSYTGSNSSVTTGAWQHIAASYDGTNVNYYINGILKDSKTWGGIGTVNAEALEMGKQQATAEGDFGGKMDDLRIYNYARSADEIMTDYNAGQAVHLR